MSIENNFDSRIGGSGVSGGDRSQRNSFVSKIKRIGNNIDFLDKKQAKRAEDRFCGDVESSLLRKHLAPKLIPAFEDSFLNTNRPGMTDTEPPSGLSVLAVGAAEGHEMELIDDLLPRTKVIGLDPHMYWTKKVEERSEELSHNTTYLPETASAEKIEGIQDESQDAVTYFFVLHHIEEEKFPEIFSELNRVLKKDGRVFIVEDIVDNEAERKLTEKTDIVMNLELVGNHSHTYKSRCEWNEIFDKYGFEEIDYREEKPNKVKHGFFVLKKREK